MSVVIFAEGAALMAFSELTHLPSAAAAYLVFGLLVCMACGLTYAVVPFLQPAAMGSAAGIVGAGGNVGAVLAGFLFKAQSISSSRALFILGTAVALSALFALLLPFREAEVAQARARNIPAMGAEPAD